MDEAGGCLVVVIVFLVIAWMVVSCDIRHAGGQTREPVPSTEVQSACP